MPRKTKKDKEIARLRREVERLRKQLGSVSAVSAAKKEIRKGKLETEPLVVDIRSDLRKTLILTAICLGILFVLYLTQPRWQLRFLGG